MVLNNLRYDMDKYEMGSQLISAQTGIGLDRLDEEFMAIVDRFTVE